MMYEIMTIVPATVADTEVDGVIATLGKEIESAGAKLEKTENLGKIKLAYAIDRQRYGYYVLFYAEVEAEAMPKLEQTLRLSENSLRHMVIAREGGIPTAPFKLVAYTQPLSAEGRRGTEREARPKSDKKEVVAGAAEEVVAAKVEEVA